MQLFSESGGLWSTGAARPLIDFDVGGNRLPVAIRCRVGSVLEEHIALLDTGAVWTIVDKEIIDALPPRDVDELNELVTIHSRYGSHRGPICALPLTILADESAGRSLTVAARVLVVERWPGPLVVLGFHGLLEQVRLGIDPGISADDARVYFGPCD
jgi:hypothetical protein